jgi:hypothetical protein
LENLFDDSFNKSGRQTTSQDKILTGLAMSRGGGNQTNPDKCLAMSGYFTDSKSHQQCAKPTALSRAASPLPAALVRGPRSH